MEFIDSRIGSEHDSISMIRWAAGHVVETTHGKQRDDNGQVSQKSVGRLRYS